MAFNQIIFLFLFLPLTLLGYHLLRREVQSLFLLLASAAFYAWASPKALLVLAGVTVLSYCGAGLLGRLREKSTAAKVSLAVLVLADLGILFYFKYTNFLIESLNRFAHTAIAGRDILTPLGISFFIFQSISYLTDVFRGTVAAQRNFLHVALYFAMFPKLAQGPIMRYGDMQEDLSAHTCSMEDLASGVRRFIIGLTKKLLFADILGGVADSIFILPADGLSASLAWGGAIAYTLQIYFDFSGYSDMAIGLGRMFGYRLAENFDYPYLSVSVTEFWRKWHISLSSWFRDYLYIPLGGSRRGNQYVHVAVVFLATGIWHGAAWTFIVWGVLHGTVNILEKFLTKRGILGKLPSVLRWGFTMLIVMLGWVIFRAPSMTAALHHIRAMFGFGGAARVQYELGWFYTPKIICVMLLSLPALLPWKKLAPRTYGFLKNHAAGQTVQFLALLVMLAVCVMLAMTSTYTSFIYFQF